MSCVPLSRSELERAALPLVSDVGDILRKTDAELVRLLMSRGIPVHKPPDSVAPEPERPKPERPADAWANCPTLRLHEFLQDGARNFHAALDALSQPYLPKMAGVAMPRGATPSFRSQYAMQHQRLVELLQKLKMMELTETIILQDPDFPENDLEPFRMWRAQVEREVEHAKQQMVELRKESKDSDRRREEIDANLFKLGIINEHCLYTWKQNRLELQKQIHELDSSTNRI